jgi:energy-coupling factor transporter ATP-binding protein EcfA2
MKPKKEIPLDIVGFDDREQRHPPGITMPEWMPMHEFFMLIVAPAGCGKTTLILNLLLRIYHHYFNKIIVFSPTIHNDQKWKHLMNTKHVLRPNPHKKVWLPKLKEKQGDTVTANPSPTSDDPTPEEKEWLEMQKDLFLLENFKDKKGVKKRLGSTQFKMWKYLSSQPQYDHRSLSGQSIASADQILNKKRRIERLSSFIAQPTTPILAQQLKDYNRVLGLPEPTVVTPEDRRIFSSTAAYLAICGESGGRRGHGGRNNVIGRQRGEGGQFRQDMRGRGSERGHRGGNRPFLRRGNHSRADAHTFPNHHNHHHNDQYDVHNENKHRDHQQSSQYGLEGHDDEESAQSNDDKDEELEEMNQGRVSKKWLHEEYSEETLDEAMKYQDKVVACLTKMKRDMTQADHICWVFDDMVGSGLFNQKRNNAFKRLSVRRRHFCSSVIGVVQAYKEFPKTSRNNCNVYILFRIDSEDELSVIYKDFPCGLSAEHWKIVYEYCVREPYGFMMINTQVKDPTLRIIKNFNEPLYIPQDKRQHDDWVQQFRPTESIEPSIVDAPSVSNKRTYASKDLNSSSCSSTGTPATSVCRLTSNRKR